MLLLWILGPALWTKQIRISICFKSRFVVVLSHDLQNVFQVGIWQLPVQKKYRSDSLPSNAVGYTLSVDQAVSDKHSEEECRSVVKNVAIWCKNIQKSVSRLTFNGLREVPIWISMCRGFHPLTINVCTNLSIIIILRCTNLSIIRILQCTNLSIIIIGQCRLIVRAV